MHITKHPSGDNDATQLKSASLTLKPKVPCFISSSVGDVKPKTVPAAKAPRVAENQNNNDNTVIYGDVILKCLLIMTTH